MSEQEANRQEDGDPRDLPVVLVMFFGSGCAALICEIVWFQLLELVIGSSAVSLGVLLGTFMGGMCLGSLMLPRLISARRHPLRVYAAIESGIALFAVGVGIAMPYVGRFYTTVAAHGFGGIVWRGVASGVCLLPPTFLMGATLPALARGFNGQSQRVRRLGFLYGGNIAGAVFGCLFAGFYLLRVHNLATATFVAAAISGSVALMAFGLAARRPHAANFCPGPAGEPGVSDSRLVSVTIALSGLCALGAEVIWTRLLSLMLGPTVYTFSIILAVFLFGLGIGSSLGAVLARGIVSARIALGACQFLLTAAIGWTAWVIARSLPFWPINPSLSRSPWFGFQLDLARCLWAILPATILWGASFPLAIAAVARPGADLGRLVGGIYTANTIGGIIGAVGFSIFLIAWIGTQHAQQLLIVLSALGSLVMLESVLRPFRGTGFARQREGSGARIAGAGLLVGIAICAGTLVWTVPEVPGRLIAYGRYLATRSSEEKILCVAEGMNASVAVTETGNGVRNFHVSGKVEASSEPQDMRLQRMLGHIPALLHPKARSALIVGCGAGVTAGSLAIHPEIERIVICEIEPLVPRLAARYFSRENHEVLSDPRVSVVFDDARHYLPTTSEKFDILTSDPIHPWVKGAAALYTKEYFALVREHLNPGGLVTQWVPLYESDLGAVKSEIATFFSVFPNGTIWSNDQDGEGYDVVLLGQADAAKIDLDDLHRRFQEDNGVTRSLKEVGFRSMVSLLATYAGQGRDLSSWLEHAEINQDGNLRLQYLAGLGLNLDQGGRIYDEMLSHRRFPEELFVGTDQRRQMVKLVMAGSPSGK